jgi:phasin family protein
MVDSVEPGTGQAGGEATLAQTLKPVADTPAATPEAIAPDAASNAGPVTAKKSAGRPKKDAVETKTAAVPVVATPVIETPAIEIPAVEAPVVKAVTPAKAPAPKRPVRKARPVTQSAKPAETPARTASAKPAPVSPAPANKTPQPSKSAAAPLLRTATASRKEHSIMTATTTEYTEKFQTAIKDASEKAKAAFEKSQASFGEIGAFTKGNVEALVESSKILASGLQELTKGYAAESKSAFEALTAEFKSLAAVKSPSELLEKQSTLLRKQFDAAVAASSKNSEAVLKLANEAFQPISNRVSIAVEKVKHVA